MTTVRLPDGPTSPQLVQNLALLTSRTRTIRRWRRRYGSTFTAWMPRHGRCVVLSDPVDVKQLLTVGADLADNAEGTLGRILGPGSMFALAGRAHRDQRKLLAPPFHGRRLGVYDEMVAAEASREFATWPVGRPVASMESMMRITLNVILRAVFGADGAEYERLRVLLPKMVVLGSVLVAIPVPGGLLGRYGPWSRFTAYRREYDAIVDRLIARREGDEHLADRDDVLSMMVQTEYDDGSPMSRRDIADQLLTLLSAGHETTATTLAWTIERLRRHPELLSRLVVEADEGGSRLRAATLLEVQRVRPVIDFTSRRVLADSIQVGEKTFSRGQCLVVSIRLLHENEAVFPNATTFDPDRFLDRRPDLYQWIPFGGGVRRCIGAAFATMEMNVVLRTLLREYTLVPTGEPDERAHFRGVALAPAKKGIAVVHRRAGTGRPVTDTFSAVTA